MRDSAWACLPLLLAGCGHKATEDAATKRRPAAGRAGGGRRRRGTLERTLPATGTLTALRDHEATLSPPVAGVLDELPIRYGQAVHKGQVIAHLATRQLQGQIQQAQATIGQNLVQVQQAQANALQQQAQTRTAILQAQSALSGAQATLAGTRATLIGNEAALHNAEQTLTREQTLFAEGLVRAERRGGRRTGRPHGAGARWTPSGRRWPRRRRRSPGSGRRSRRRGRRPCRTW